MFSGEMWAAMNAAMNAAAEAARAAGLTEGPYGDGEDFGEMSGTRREPRPTERVTEEERARMEARRCFVICEVARDRGWRARFVQDPGTLFGLSTFRAEFWTGKETVSGHAGFNKVAALQSACGMVEGMLV